MAALSPRYALDVVTMLGGGFLALSALTFTAGTAGWLAFGVSTAIAVLAAAGALADLTVHEVTTERVVHAIDVRSGTETQATGQTLAA